MKTQRISNPVLKGLVLTAALYLAAMPAYGASKEIIQLQTQVQQLQEQMATMKQSFDERMGVMKNLVEQNTDAANKTTAAIKALQDSLQKQQGDSSGRVDQLSGQIQALNDTLDELKVRLAKVSKQLEDLQASQQSIAAQQQAAQAQQQAQAQAPPPDVLYVMRCATTTAGKMTWHRRNFPTTSSFIRIPTLLGIPTSTSPNLSSVPAIIRRPSQTTIWSCKTSPAEIKRHPRN